MATDTEEHLDKLFQKIPPMTDLEAAEIVRGYLDTILGAMDRTTLVTFRAQCVAKAAVTATQPVILPMIDRRLRCAKEVPLPGTKNIRDPTDRIPAGQ